MMKIVLFDGVCNLCSGAVQFIIRHDAQKKFHFAPLQSAIACKLIDKAQVEVKKMDTILFLHNGRVYYRSDAVLQICKHLDGLWFLLAFFLIIPRFLRDFIYEIVSKKRYRWFGKKDACMIVTDENKERFLT